MLISVAMLIFWHRRWRGEGNRGSRPQVASDLQGQMQAQPQAQPKERKRGRKARSHVQRWQFCLGRLAQEGGWSPSEDEGERGPERHLLPRVRAQLKVSKDARYHCVCFRVWGWGAFKETTKGREKSGYTFQM